MAVVSSPRADAVDPGGPRQLLPSPRVGGPARLALPRRDRSARPVSARAGLVQDAGLLEAASRRIDSGSEEQVLQLATHLGSREQADALYVLTLANDELDSVERSRLGILHQLIDAALSRPDLTGREAGNI